MYIVTYKMKNREKTYSGDTVPQAHKEFLKNYAEAAGEVKKVIIEKGADYNFKIVTSYPTFRDYFAKPINANGKVAIEGIQI